MDKFDIIIIVIAAMVFTFVILVPLYLSAPKQAPVEKSPVVYVLNFKRYVDFYDNENFVLQYAINGEIQQAIFGTEEERAGFIKYLSTIGTIVKE